MSEQREIQEVLARYVRAADQRDGAAMGSVFLPDGKVEIYDNTSGTPPNDSARSSGGMRSVRPLAR
jgi:hypothetical protein